MLTQTIRYPTLAEVLWPRHSNTTLRSVSLSKVLLRPLVLVITGTALLALSAKIQIPFRPVPLTMQTLVVLGVGFAYGWKLGGATMLFYLVAGGLGLPIFAGKLEESFGLGPILGPSGGYLFGFIVAAAFCGLLAQRGWDRHPIKTFVAMLMGNCIIYGFGLLQLGFVVGWDKPLLQWGLIPFLPGDLLKIILAVLVMPTAWKLLKK